MSRYLLISVLLIVFAVISCQPKEQREVVTTTTQTATMKATDTRTIADVPPSASSTVIPTAAITGTTVTTAVTTTAPVTPAAKPAAATPAPRAPAPKPVAATPKPPPEASTPATTPAQQPGAPATESATTPAGPTPAPEPVATTPPAKTPTSTRNLPKTHTVDHGGVKHAAGSDNPTLKCAACHGKDLRGGKVAKASCFECHEKVWK